MSEKEIQGISSLCLVGALGRMGRSVLSVIDEFPELNLKHAVVSGKSQSSLPNELSSKIQPASDLEKCINQSDLILDFSTAENSLKVASFAKEAGKPTLIATTGHTEANIEFFKGCGKKIPILIAPNTSYGMAVFNYLAKEAKRLLGEEFDIEIVEAHHKNKKDAPSGTALRLAESLKATTNGGHKGRNNENIPISSIRGGGIVGEHFIYFMGDSERIELAHRAENRLLFAKGALKLISILGKLAPDCYKVEQLLGVVT